MKTVSVVVISFNGREFLRNTLSALSCSEVKPIQIIVVDDASSDGTAEMVSQEFPDVEVVVNEMNKGTSASRNEGARHASGDYILFLDNDIEINSKTIGKLRDFLDTTPEAGMATARLFSEDGSQRFWNVGYDPNNARSTVGAALGVLVRIVPRVNWMRRAYEKFDLNLWNHEAVRSVEWVVEECFMISRDFFAKLGGFDEQFFMYFEGPDLCKRVRNANKLVYFTPHATAMVHEGHAHSSAKRAKLFEQSKYRYYKKHYFYLKSNPILFWLWEIFAAVPQIAQVWKKD